MPPVTQRGRRRAERPDEHGRWPVVLGLVALVAVVVTALALQLGLDPTGGVPEPSPSTSSRTPSGATALLDLSNLPVRRSVQCAAVDDEALVTALGGGPVTSRTSYASGDRVEIVPGVTDIAHENLCGFGSTRAEAKVWVFAAPVGTARARHLVREGRAATRCTFPSDATRFGTPGLTSVCRRSGATVATLRGLFGDAWFSCELSVAGEADRDVVRRRADRWCVHVATTLGARP